MTLEAHQQSGAGIELRDIRTEIRRQLISLRDEWEDHPETTLLPKDYGDPAVLAAKRKNKRRAGAWFGPLIIASELALPHINDSGKRSQLESDIDNLRERVRQHTDGKSRVTDDEVADGEKLIAATLELLDAEERQP